MENENTLTDMKKKWVGADPQFTRVYKGFTSLSVYEEVFPIVIKTIQILQSYKWENKEGDFIDLINRAQNCAVLILTNLADGYNKYHAEDKVVLYNMARSNVSNTQSLMLILSALEIIPKSLTDNIVRQFNEKIKMFNGIIKKMEDKA